MTTGGGAHRAGIARRRARIDRDGDMVMQNGSPKPPKGPAGRSPAAAANRASDAEVELRVVGWIGEDGNSSVERLQSLLSFLEKHARKRAPTRLMPIKRSRIQGGAAFIRVRSDDATVFSKLHGFSFQGQKLAITNAAVRPASPPGLLSEGNTSGNIRQQLIDFLNRRYRSETKLLDLSTLSGDPQLHQIGMFDSLATQEKFFPALMKMCDAQFKSADEKRDVIQSVTLAGNSLSNLSIVTSLASTLPDLKHLDLSNNKLSNLKDLQNWQHKFRHLELLVIVDNPILNLQPGWETEIIKWFPRLRTLNGVEVRSEQEVSRVGQPRQTPLPSKNPIWQDMDGVAERFLVDFYAGFDQNRAGVVGKYYDNESTFSLSYIGRSNGGTKNPDRVSWEPYFKLSRNLTFITKSSQRNMRKMRGTDSIRRCWADIPPTRHPSFQTELDKYCIDCQRQSGLPGASGSSGESVLGLIITVHGVLEELDPRGQPGRTVRRNFDRAFVIGPGGSTGVRVISDAVCLRPHGGTPAWQQQDALQTADGRGNAPPTGPAAGPNAVSVATSASAQGPTNPSSNAGAGSAVSLSLAPTEEKMMDEVMRRTSMNLSYSKQLLDAAQWDLNQAMNLFAAYKPTLGDEAFA